MKTSDAVSSCSVGFSMKATHIFFNVLFRYVLFYWIVQWNLIYQNPLAMEVVQKAIIFWYLNRICWNTVHRGSLCEIITIAVVWWKACISKKGILFRKRDNWLITLVMHYALLQLYSGFGMDLKDPSMMLYDKLSIQEKK